MLRVDNIEAKKPKLVSPYAELIQNVELGYIQKSKPVWQHELAKDKRKRNFTIDASSNSYQSIYKKEINTQKNGISSFDLNPKDLTPFQELKRPNTRDNQRANLGKQKLLGNELIVQPKIFSYRESFTSPENSGIRISLKSNIRQKRIPNVSINASLDTAHVIGHSAIETSSIEAKDAR